MALSKKEAVGTNQYEIEFQVDKDVFEAAVNDAYKKKIGKLNVPGFRRGKAPRSIVEKMYGKGVFYDDALDAVLPAAYEAAVKEAALDVVGQPQIGVVSVEDGATFKATVYVKPQCEIDGYLGIKCERKVKRVL